MEKYQFDIYGNLFPSKIHDVDLESIKYNLSEIFETSNTRKLLFDALSNYLDDFSKLLDKKPFEVLIDGSFVTKKLHPNDIDLVIIVDSFTLEAIIDKELEKFRCHLAKKELENYKGIHAFIIEKYPESDRKYPLFRSGYLYWTSFFSKDRKGYKKGLLRLIF